MGPVVLAEYEVGLCIGQPETLYTTKFCENYKTATCTVSASVRTEQIHVLTVKESSMQVTKPTTSVQRPTIILKALSTMGQTLVHTATAAKVHHHCTQCVCLASVAKLRQAPCNAALAGQLRPLGREATRHSVGSAAAQSPPQSRAPHGVACW
jgi:hypothetical protein